MRSYEFESQAQVAFNAFNLAKPWALVKIPDDITPLVQFIKSNCTPWLSLKTRTPLYRGISHHGSGHKAETAFILPVRKDRKPLDSTVGMHKVFNQLIAMAGGTANRSNSMFTTPVYSNAITYGMGFIVMPIGEFHYTWADGVYDWYREYKSPAIVDKFFKDSLDKQAIYKSLWAEVEGGASGSKHNPEVPDMFFDASNYDVSKIKKIIQCDTGMHDALRDEYTEIMVQCNSALYMNQMCYDYIKDELR